MKFTKGIIVLGFIAISFFAVRHADAALTLTAGTNATTTPNVATSITGFQIVGSAASTTPVQLRATSGTLSMTTTSGLTFDGATSGSTVNFSGTVANINAALATLKYTRATTGSDTLEVSLVNKGEIFFTDNNHLYKFIAGGYGWTAAKAAAEAQTAYGASGYLVTITSSAENAFVSARLTGDGWIGAADSETEGTWKWMTGPEAGTSFWQGVGNGSPIGGRYSAWAGGEPNQSGEEDCAETYVSSGTWNDFPCGASLGYVVEFGAPGNMPTVVATNISVVTADVPAVTTLSPANGSSAISTTSNLVIGFSKTVTKNTGSILIKKTSDNSTVETIDASGSQVTGSNSTSITINPDTTLDEGTSYYVVVPGTAFKDSSNNFFDGISGSSTWVFTTADLTSPTISNIATSSVGTTSATVTWNTNESASTKLVYSTGLSFASTTSETDTSPRVTSHTKSLASLSACTVYNYKVVSGDAFGNYATSSSSYFITAGCVGSTAPLLATTTTVTVSAAATTTLTDSGRTLTVATPPNFTATSSTVVIQIKSVNADTVLASTTIPANLSKATEIVFDVTALINSSIVLDSFNTPVTISYQYTDADIAGLNESSLSMFHYHNNVWEQLSNCSIDTAANIITCTTPSFSIFAIFGSPSVPPSTTSSGRNMSSGTGSIQVRVNNLYALGNPTAAEQLKKEWPQYYSNEVVTTGNRQTRTLVGSDSFTRDLKRSMQGSDVAQLQQLLIAKNTGPDAQALAKSGATGYFGGLTQKAVIEFQVKNNISPAVGYFGAKTRAVITK